MKKQNEVISTQAQEPEVTNQEAKVRAGRTHAHRRSVVTRALSHLNRNEDTGKGAPPCNTAPANSIEPQILRVAIDSLYVSFHGVLSDDMQKQLLGLKRLAQSEERSEQPKAQIKIEDHLFEVMDKGARRFAYVLVNNWFRISIPSSADSSLPMAFVQISSEVLTLAGPVAAIESLKFIVNTLGQVQGTPQLSRVDPCLDFVVTQRMDAWERDSWVTRARNVNKHYDGKEFSGWSIGVGGSMGARLYNKTLEIRKSKKTYLYPIWESAGWDLQEAVWRLEFEIKRDVLKELQIFSFGDLLMNLSGLWEYATSEWLRLAIPNSSDATQSRWPCHPLWTGLQCSERWGDDQDYMPISRIRKQRIPRDETLFVQGLAHITSFMAREGITEFDEGVGEFIHRAVEFHKMRDKSALNPIEGYVKQKVAEKGRKYNSIDQRDLSSKEDLKEKAKAYRKAKDGE